MSSTDDPSQPTTVHPAPASIFASLELSRSRWLVTVMMPGGDKMSKYSVPGGDGGALLASLARLRARAERHAASPVGIVTIQEAGFDGFWIHRLLQANGIESHVVEPASIAVPRRHRRAKTDAIDGEALLRTLMAFQRGEPRVCSMVVPPSPEAEDRRRPPPATPAEGRNRPAARAPRAARAPDRRGRGRAWRPRAGGGPGADAGGAADAAAGHRARVRHRAVAGGPVPALREPAAAGRLRGPCSQPVAEWNREGGARHLEIGQPATAHDGDRARLALAPPPARDGAEPLVPGAREVRPRSRPPRLDRGAGEKAPRRLVAVRDRWRGPGGGHAQGGLTGPPNRLRPIREAWPASLDPGEWTATLPGRDTPLTRMVPLSPEPSTPSMGDCGAAA